MTKPWGFLCIVYFSGDYISAISSYLTSYTAGVAAGT
nr:MAG TPA: hypothetical protein [Caudoviricetes sp.]